MIFSKLLFMTHTPQIFARGQKWRSPDGKLWHMTKIKRTSPTILRGGGVASCWKVYGKR